MTREQLTAEKSSIETRYAELQGQVETPEFRALPGSQQRAIQKEIAGRRMVISSLSEQIAAIPE